MGSGSPCLLIGESGTSKSVTIASFLSGLDPGSNITLNMNFSSRTSSLDVQRAIEDSTEKRTKVGFGIKRLQCSCNIMAIETAHEKTACRCCTAYSSA